MSTDIDNIKVKNSFLCL